MLNYTLQVTVFLMARKPSGVYAKTGTPVEFTIDRYTSY